MTKKKLTRLVVVAVVVLGVAGGTAYAVALVDEPFVYDATIDETVPAALDAGLQNAIGDPHSPTGDGGDPVAPPPDEAPPAPYAGSVTRVDGDGDTPPPFGAETLRPTTAWSSGDSTGATIVYAGAVGDNARNGLLIQTRVDYASGENSLDTHPLTGTGAVTLVGATGSTLRFTTASGYGGTYDTTTQEVTLQTCKALVVHLCS